MHNPAEVYKAGNGWVRQFEDGTILGPFETIDGATYAKRPEATKVVPIEVPLKQEVVIPEVVAEEVNEEIVTEAKTFGSQKGRK